jgi:hypothetical protein
VAEITSRQIYDLLLEISRDVAELDASIDELLLDMKALTQELIPVFVVIELFPRHGRACPGHPRL